MGFAILFLVTFINIYLLIFLNYFSYFCQYLFFDFAKYLLYILLDCFYMFNFYVFAMVFLQICYEHICIPFNYG